MKYKTNISAIVLALLIFCSSNGVALFEHICNSSQTRNYSFFSNSVCEMEKPESSCCKKMGLKKKKDCCEHKQFFSKLNIEGFTAKQLVLKSFEKDVVPKFFSSYVSVFNQQIFEAYYSGIPPPDNLHTIKYLLRPTSVGLQIFRC